MRGGSPGGATSSSPPLTPSDVQVSGYWSIPARYASIRRVPTGIHAVWEGPTRGTSPRDGTFCLPTGGGPPGGYFWATYEGGPPGLWVGGSPPPHLSRLHRCAD